MDRLSNLTRGVNTTTSDQNCTTNSTPGHLEKLLTTPSLIAVNQDLRWIFRFHAYGFACLFILLGLYTFFSILNLRSLISSRPFMSTINLFLCLLGISRALCLFIDPYNLKEIIPKFIGLFMWDIGFPCITSAFGLIQLAVLQLTQLKFGPEKLKIESCLSVIITLQFFLHIANDVFLVFHNYYIAKYVIQIIFLIWSILLYITFLYAGYKVMNLSKSIPSSMLTRDSVHRNEKGIMQLAMLAPYSNLVPSITAALVPTLIGRPFKPQQFNIDLEQTASQLTTTTVQNSIEEFNNTTIYEENQEMIVQPSATVPEVYVRPPTPTPSAAILPVITVSSPSRRSSLASRRGSDVSSRSSRRDSECSVRFKGDNDDTVSPVSESRRNSDFSRRCYEEIERARSSDSFSREEQTEDMETTGSARDLRRCSDFSHEKNRGSQFATKLRRNSDFGNRIPRRMMLNEENPKLPRLLDTSPSASRRNSDIGNCPLPKCESRRNSEASFRRNSEMMNIKPLNINRRASDISIKTWDKSPSHFQDSIPERIEATEKLESNTDQIDCNEKASLMNEKPNNKCDDIKQRKKSLSWKNEKNKNDTDDITAENNLLLPEISASAERGMGTGDLTLHSILNHIAYVNRSTLDVSWDMPESNIAAAKRLQIRRVITVTYATTILGIILCIAEFARIFGPYGILAETVKYNVRPPMSLYPKPWPWLLYQTICRSLEFIMGCAMASVSKQPSTNLQYCREYPNYNRRLRNSLYM